MEEIMEKSISVIYGWCMKFSLDNGSQEEVNNKTGWEEYTPLGIHNTVVELFVVNFYIKIVLLSTQDYVLFPNLLFFNNYITTDIKNILLPF